LPAGSHTLVVSLDGHYDETIIVAVAPAASTEETVALKKREPGVAVPVAASAQTKPGVAPRWTPPNPARPTVTATAIAVVTPPAPVTVVAPSKPNIQVLDNDPKPKSNVDIVH
jgi:hypothetical protein